MQRKINNKSFIYLSIFVHLNRFFSIFLVFLYLYFNVFLQINLCFCFVFIFRFFLHDNSNVEELSSTHIKTFTFCFVWFCFVCGSKRLLSEWKSINIILLCSDFMILTILRNVRFHLDDSFKACSCICLLLLWCFCIQFILIKGGKNIYKNLHNSFINTRMRPTH